MYYSTVRPSRAPSFDLHSNWRFCVRQDIHDSFDHQGHTIDHMGSGRNGTGYGLSCVGVSVAAGTDV